MPVSTQLHAAIALIAYAEPFVDGRRVLLCGNALSEIPERLLERGARLVHVCDPEAARVSEAAAHNASRNVTFAPLAEGALAFRDGVFDLVLVEDVSALANPTAVLRRLRRALSPNGAAILISPNAEVRARLLPAGPGATALDYYALFDLVSSEFEHVRMLGQAPFVGYAIADFAADAADLEPSIDTGFLPGGAEEPEYFVALATEHELSLDAFTIVQLPLALAAEQRANAHLEQKLTAAQSAERLARDRMAELEAELTARHASMSEAGELVRLRQELERREQWIVQLEQRATTADTRADQAEEELEQSREELRAAKSRSVELAPRVDTERAAREANEARAEVERLRAELAGIRQATAASEARSEAARQAVAATERSAQAAREEASAARAKAVEARAEAGTLRAEVGEARTEAGKLRAEAATARAEAGKLRAEATAAQADAGRLRADAAAAQAEANRLRSEAAAAQADAGRLRADAAAAQAEANRLRSEAAAAQSDAGKLRAEVDRLRAELEPLRSAAASAKAEAEAARGQASGERAALEEVARDAAELEQKLAERGQVVQELELRLREARRVGQSLLRRLEVLPSELPTLLTRLAEQEAELEASRWTTDRLVADLEASSAASEAQAREVELLRSRVQQGSVLREQLMANSEVAPGIPGAPDAFSGHE